MKIIIVGAGIIGFNLARSLAEEDHEVYLLENDEEIARKSDEKLDVKVVIGSGTDPDTLKKVFVSEADLVVAVTSSDEVNLVVCSLAASYGAKRRIARVRNTALSKALDEFRYKSFFIDEIINTDQVAAQTIAKTVRAPGTREVADFVHGQILLRAFDLSPTSHLCGLQVVSLRDEDFPWPFLIIAISRNGTVIIPKGDTTIESGDRIYVLLPAQSLAEFLTFVDPEIRLPKKVIVYGASDMGEKVANILSEFIKEVVLLEENPEKAQDVAERLASVRVINGSAAETEILMECGIEATDAFIATTDNDPANLVSAVLAKKLGAKSATITTHNPDYLSIIGALDIDSIVNPRLLASEQILRLVRGEEVKAVTKLIDCDAEAIEFVPEPNSPVTKSPIKDINFPKNSIVGAVYSDSEVILASGDTQIKAGERVIVFCQQEAVKKLQKLFTHKKII